MACIAGHRDISPTLAAARRWINDCLVADKTVYGDRDLWTPDLIREVREAFDSHPDTGRDRFIVKLRRQMTTCSPAGQQLMSEQLWALLLFPDSVAIATKRKQLREIWDLSGAPFPEGREPLQDAVLQGIGSGGVGFNANRPKELSFLLALVTSVKELSGADRRRVLGEYEAFVQWIDSVPQFGHRQFRHMLRYFAFPDIVERMSSNDHRRAVLDAFDVASSSDTKRWTDAQLDKALLELRHRLEQQYPAQALDFYEDPLRSKWKSADDDSKDEEESSEVATVTSSASADSKPINLILYGPPGTGKTHWLRRKFEDYTEQPNVVDEGTWLQDRIAPAGWREIIAASIADLGDRAKVPDIRQHRWIEAKVRSRGRAANINHTIWASLQTHTPLSVESVKYANRREPFLFSKEPDGQWRLLPDWRDQDDEAAALFDALRAGPQSARSPIHRYRVVTFHPSFSYEDFVRGIRPVITGDDGSTEFRNVDGVFKRLCDEARANPSKRYALFVDEINRANIAKVFGELITLIEVDKRSKFDTAGNLIDGMEVQLPGSFDSERPDPPFSVPANLDIYGSMNTADRSIALLDIALRRRFEFLEMEPNYEVLDRMVDSVHLGRLLSQINDRVEYLLDRDHRIGHAYLMGVDSLSDLRAVFVRHVVPLLYEFFFDDASKVAQVLQTSSVESPFIIEQRLSYSTIFGSSGVSDTPLERRRYVLTLASTWSAASFRGVYDTRVTTDEPSA